jgi:TPR repeat protein
MKLYLINGIKLMNKLIKVLQCFAFLLFLGVVGCSGTPTHSDSSREESAAAVQALKEQIQLEFNRAKLSYLRGDYEQARRAFLPLAQAGHADSQYALGYMFFYGQGGEMDMEQAYAWMQHAAEQGNEKAFKAIARINQARERLVNPAE